MTHYTAKDLHVALEQLPLVQGDVLFMHSNLGFFGRPADICKGSDLCQMFFDAIMMRLGGIGTLVMPTFTYSFPRLQVFDPAAPVLEMGMFSEWMRQHPNAKRSMDPCYSVAAVGRCAEELTKDVPENSFGEGSFFDRFYQMGGKILNLNFDAGSTFIHYVERKLRVPYRFDKTFGGVIREGNDIRNATSTIWVRHLSDDALEASFECFDQLSREQGFYKICNLGRGQLGLISAIDTFTLIAETLPIRPWFLTKAEALGKKNPVLDPVSHFI